MLLFSKIFVVIFVVKLRVENSYGQLDLPHHKNGLAELNHENDRIPSFLTPTTSVFKRIIDNRGIRRRQRLPRRMRGVEKRNSRTRKSKFLKDINHNNLSEQEGEYDLLTPAASHVIHDYQLPNDDLPRAHLWSGLNFDSQFHPQISQERLEKKHHNHKQRNILPEDSRFINAYYFYPYQQNGLYNSDNYHYDGINKNHLTRSVKYDSNEMEIASREDSDEQNDDEYDPEAIGEIENLYPHSSIHKRQIDPRLNFYQGGFPGKRGYRSQFEYPIQYVPHLPSIPSVQQLRRLSHPNAAAHRAYLENGRMGYSSIAPDHNMSHLEKENKYVNPAVLDDYISSVQGHNYENFKPRIYKKSTLSEPTSKEKLIDAEDIDDKKTKTVEENRTEAPEVESSEVKKVNHTSLQDIEESIEVGNGDVDPNTSVDGDFHLIDLRSLSQNGDEEPEVFTYIISPDGRTFVEVDPIFFRNATLPLLGSSATKDHQSTHKNHENDSEINEQSKEIILPNPEIKYVQPETIRAPPKPQMYYSYGPPSTLYTKYYTKSDSNGKPQIFLENQMGKTFLLPNEDYERFTQKLPLEQRRPYPGFNVDFSYDVPMQPQYRNTEQNEDPTNPIMYILNGVPYRMPLQATDQERTFGLLKKELQIKKAIIDKKLGKLQKITCGPDKNQEQYYTYVSDYASPVYKSSFGKREETPSKRSSQLKNTDLEASETTDDHPSVQRRDCNCQQYWPLYNPNLLYGYSRMPQVGADQRLASKKNIRLRKKRSLSKAPILPNYPSFLQGVVRVEDGPYHHNPFMRQHRNVHHSHMVDNSFHNPLQAAASTYSAQPPVVRNYPQPSNTYYPQSRRNHMPNLDQLPANVKHVTLSSQDPAQMDNEICEAIMKHTEQAIQQALASQINTAPSTIVVNEDAMNSGLPSSLTNIDGISSMDASEISAQVVSQAGTPVSPEVEIAEESQIVNRKVNPYPQFTPIGMPLNGMHSHFHPGNIITPHAPNIQNMAPPAVAVPKNPPETQSPAPPNNNDEFSSFLKMFDINNSTGNSFREVLHVIKDKLFECCEKCKDKILKGIHEKMDTDDQNNTASVQTTTPSDQLVEEHATSIISTTVPLESCSECKQVNDIYKEIEILSRDIWLDEKGPSPDRSHENLKSSRYQHICKQEKKKLLKKLLKQLTDMKRTGILASEEASVESVRDESLRMPFTPILGRPYLGLWRPGGWAQQWSPPAVQGTQQNNEHRDRTQRALRSLGTAPIRIQTEKEKLGPGMRFKKQLTKRSQDKFP